MFGLSNRVAVELAFWPFGMIIFPWLGLLILIIFAAGFFFGLLFHLPHRISAGRRAKRAEKRAAELEAKHAPPLTTP